MSRSSGGPQCFGAGKRSRKELQRYGRRRRGSIPQQKVAKSASDSAPASSMEKATAVVDDDVSTLRNLQTLELVGGRGER